MTEPSALKIQWTEHALHRAIERFGPDNRIIIPNRILAMKGESVDVGDKFRLRRKQVCYVCRRTEDAVVIVTVYKNIPACDHYQEETT